MMPALEVGCEDYMRTVSSSTYQCPDMVECSVNGSHDAVGSNVCKLNISQCPDRSQ